VEGTQFQFAVLLAVLGLTAAISLSLRLPVVPLYIGAGVLLPSSGILAPDEIVEFLGSLGVVFLLFSMGLEFSVSSFTREPERFLGAGSIDFFFNFPVGLIAGRLLGWSWEQSFFLAGILYMSSSAVVSKCIADFGRAARPETETILRIMVFEDLAIAVYLVLLNSFAGGAESGSGWTPVWSLVYIGALVVLARRYQASLTRLIASHSEEAFLLALFAFVLFIASTAGLIGLSDALGAFLAGLVIGSTELKERAAHTLQPFQTLFAALFFVSFGISLDLGSLSDLLLPALLLVVIGAATKTLGGFVSGRVAGHNPAQSTVIGLSLVPKGEFSIVIAGLAAASAQGDSGIVALTGVYVFALSIIGPIGMREADRVRDFLFRPKPKPANS
jgi:CPA2 family monovalent cation:H+ antiporter-2